MVERTLAERVSALEASDRIDRDTIDEIRHDVKILLTKADEARGRAEIIKIMVGSLPSAIWMLTVGSAVGALTYFWHQIPGVK